MNVFPDFDGLGGIGDLKGVIGALLTFVLIIAVLMLIVSAIIWAIASAHGNHATASKARTGTRLDRDRPTRQTTWPGEKPGPSVDDVLIEQREKEFVAFVLSEVAAWEASEDAFYATLDEQTGEIRWQPGT